MKFSKPAFLISLSFGVLLLGGLVLIYHKRKSLPVQVKTKRYPHEHLRAAQWEPKNKLTADVYTLNEGDSLANVARLRYGHQNYSRVIKLYNRIENERSISAGTNLKLPDMHEILSQEGFSKVAARETELILCARAKYDRVVDQLWKRRAQQTNPYPLPQDIQQQLLEAADDLQQTIEGLKTSKPGVNKMPSRLIGQLEENMGVIRNLAAGDEADPNGYDIDIVQQRYALALAYAIIWAREGFN